METRQLGKTGLVVSRLGLGLAALGRPGYINLGHAGDLGRDYDVAAMEAKAHAVLDAAWDAGVRYFDAARSYGRAEAFLSSWLSSRGLSPGEVTVGSKWGYTYTAGWNVKAERHEVKDHALGTLRCQAAESKDVTRPVAIWTSVVWRARTALFGIATSREAPDARQCRLAAALTGRLAVQVIRSDDP
jgi:aryl-alcohol dehydrogenase-like predicted oxidoreductase